MPRICGRGRGNVAVRRDLWKGKRIEGGVGGEGSDLRVILRLREEGQGKENIYRREKIESSNFIPRLKVILQTQGFEVLKICEGILFPFHRFDPREEMQKPRDFEFWKL